MRLLLSTMLLILFISLAHAACTGVIICDETYNCGVADGFCPADVGCQCDDPDCVGAGAGAGGGVGGVGAAKIVSNCTQDAEYLKLPPASKITYQSPDFCVDLRWAYLEVGPLSKTTTFIIKQETIGNRTCYARFNLTYYNVTNGTLEFRVPRWWLREFKIMPWTVGINAYVYGRNETSDYLYFKTKEIRQNYTVCGEYVDFWRLLDAIDAYYSGKVSFSYILQMLVVYYG